MASATGTGTGRIPITLILVFVLYLGNEIWTGLTQPDNISQLTHIAGGICGAFFGFSYSKRRKV
jgi:rhomboid protease GluP